MSYTVPQACAVPYCCACPCCMQYSSMFRAQRCALPCTICTGLCLRGVRRRRRFKNKACKCPKKCDCTLLRNTTQHTKPFLLYRCYIIEIRTVYEYCALLCAVVLTVLYCTVLSTLFSATTIRTTTLSYTLLYSTFQCYTVCTVQL